MEDCSLGPEYSDVDVTHILRNVTRVIFFEFFSVKEKKACIQSQESGDGMIVKD